MSQDKHISLLKRCLQVSAHWFVRLFTLLTFLTLVGSSSAHAGTVTTGGTGAWSSTTPNAPWPGGVIPATTDDIIIGAGFTLTVDGDRTCNSMTVGNGSTLAVNSGFLLTVTASISFPNLATGAATGTLSGAGSITAATLDVGGTTTPTGAGTITVSSSVTSLTVSGNLTLTSLRPAALANNPTFNHGSGAITINGSLASVTAANAGSTTLYSLNTGAGTGTLVLAGATPITTSGNAGVPTFTFSGTGSTVNYSYAGAQTVRDVAYRNLITSGSGTKAWTELAARIVGGNLTVGDGTTLSIAGAFAWTVTGATTIGTGTSGTLSITNATGTKTFTGAVTISSGGDITETAAATLSFGSDVSINGTLAEFGAAVVSIAGSLANNGTYTASTGVHTFSGATKTISGTTAVSIPSVTVSGTYTNNGTLTVGTALSGAGTLTNGATGTLNIGGTSGITTLTANASGNQVNYNGTGSQTIKPTDYSNLGIAGARTTNSVTIAGALGVAGTLTNSASFTSGNYVLTGSTITFNGSGGQTVPSLNGSSFSNLTLSGSGTKTFAAATSILGTLSISAGVVADLGTFTSTATALTLGGAGQVGGTWGSTSSSAANPNDVYFAATTGIVDVSGELDTWLGGTSTDWSSASNWSVGVPTSSSSVVIPSGGNQPAIGNGVTADSKNITVNSGATLTNNGTLTVVAALSGTGTLTNAATGTLNIGGTSAITTLTASAVGNTVNYTGAAQTVHNNAYHHLSLSGSLAKTMTGITTVAGNFTMSGSASTTGMVVTTIGGYVDLSGTATATTGANLAVTGSVAIHTGASLSIGAFTFSVTSTTTVDAGGSLIFTSATNPGKTFTGDVLVNGVWNEQAAITPTFAGNFTNNATTWTASTGAHTFSGTAKVISGTTASIIPSVSVSGTIANSNTLTVATLLTVGGTLTNNGTVTATTALSGVGGLTNAATGTLNIGGTSAITTLSAAAVGNTVNYTGAAQTVHSNNYDILTLSGSGVKTLQAGMTTVGGNLTLSGTASATTVVGLSISGNLSIGSGTTFATGATFTLGVTGTTSVTGTFTLAGTGAKTFTGDVTINPGGVWNETGVAAFGIAGNFTNNATTFTASTGVHTFSGASKVISGTTASAIPSVSISGTIANSNTLTVATLLTVDGTLTNNGTVTATTALSGLGELTNAATGTLNIGAASAITTLTATAVGNTVNYTGVAQTVHVNDYWHLTFSGSGVKTLNAGITTISGNLTFAGTATATGLVGLTIGGNVILGVGTTFTSGAFTHNVAGNWTNNGGTFTAGAGTINFNGTGAQAVNGTAAAQTFFNLTINKTAATLLSAGGSTTTITVSGALTETQGDFTPPATLNVTGSVTLTAGTFSAGTNVNVGGDWTNNGGTFNANTSTVTFSGAGNASIIVNSGTLTFNNLIASKTAATDVLTLTANVSVVGNLSVSTGVFDIGTFIADRTAPGGTLTVSNLATLRIGGTNTMPGNYTTHTFGATSTIEYNGAAQAVSSENYAGHLTLSGSGIKTLQTGTTTIGGNLTLTGTVSTTTVVGLTITGNLSIGNGTTFTAAGFALTVTGTSTVGAGTSGNLTISSATGAKRFTGLVSVSAGGTWDNSGDSPIEFRGGITKNAAGTFTAGAGVHTFTTNAQVLNGVFTIPSVTVTTITVTNNGTLTVGTALSGTGGLTNAATGTLNLGGTSGITTMTSTAVGNLVNYTGTGQTLKVTAYHHLTLSGGAETFGAITTIGGNLALSGTAAATTGANLAVTGALLVQSGTSLSTGAFTLSVGSTTTVDAGGSLIFTSATNPGKTFTGDVLLNGVWNEQAAVTPSFAGSFTNNATTFTTSTGVHTFSGASKTLSGTTATVIPSATFTGTYTNSGTLTCATALSGAGTLTNGATGTLSIGGTSGITTLIASASGNQVNYNGTGAQTIASADYYNLAISGARTTNSVTIAGAVGVAGTLTNSASFTSGDFVLTGSTITFNGSGGQTVPSLNGASFSNLTLSGSGTKTFAAATSILGTLSVSGAVADLGAFTSTATALTLGGAGQVGGTWGSTSSTAANQNDVYFAPTTGILDVAGQLDSWLGGTSTDWSTGANWSAGVPTSSSSVVIPSGGNQPAIGNGVTADSKNITVNSGATLTNSGTLTVVTSLSGSGTLTNAATGTLNIGGTSAITTLTATAVGNTVNYSGTGQTLKVTAYHHLSLTGGAETFGAITTIGGNLSLSGSATATTGANLTVSGNLNVGDGTTFTAAGFALTVSGTTTVGAGTSGSLAISSATGTKTFTGAVTINSGGALTETAAATLSFGSDVTVNAGGTLTESGAAVVGIAGSLTNNGTYTASTGVHTLSGATKTISGTTAVSIPSITVSGTYTNNGTLTVGTALAGGGSLTNAGTLNIGGTSSITTLTNSGTATITGAGAISTVPANFTNTGTLNLNGSGTIAGITNNASGIVNLASSGTITSFINATATSALNISASPVPAITTLTATAAGNTVKYNSTTGAQTIKGTTYSNLTIDKLGQIGTLGAATTISGDLSLLNGTLADGGFQITGNVAGTLSVAAGATLQIGAGTATITSFPTLFTTAHITLNATSTVNYSTITNPQNVAGSVAGAGPSTYGHLTITGATGTKTLTSAITVAGNLTIATAGEILADGGNTITVNGNVTNNGTHSGAGNITLTGGGSAHAVSGGTSTFGTLILDDAANGATMTGTGTTTVGTLTVTSGILTLNAFTTGLTVSGATGVTGTININSITGTKTFTGLVTINPLGAWTNTAANSPVTFAGGITNNGTFSAGTGGLTNAGTGILNIGGTSSITTLTNSGTATITGAGAISTVLANFTNTGTLNLNGSGALTGITNNASGIINLASSGTITSLTNATATSTLNISAAPVPAITTLTATAAGNAVYYNSTTGAQTIKGTTYSNLTIDKLGQAGTLGAATTISNNLSVLNGTLADGGFQITGNGTGTLTVAAGATLQIGAGVANAETFPTLFITANTTLAAASTVIYNSTSAMTVAGSVAGAGPSTYGNLTLSGASTKTAAAAITVAGNLTINAGTFADGGFQITGNGTGTLNVAGGATLQIGAGAANTETFPTLYPAANITLPATSTVVYNSTSAMTVAAGSSAGYGHLTLSGASTKTAASAFTVAGNLTINAGVFADGGNTITVNGNVTNSGTHSGAGNITLAGGGGAHAVSGGTSTFGTLILDDAANGATMTGTGTTTVGTLTVTSGTLTLNAFTTGLTVSGATGVTGTIAINSVTGTKTFTGLVTINAPGAWTNTAANSPVTLGGGITNNGSFSAGTGVYTFATNAQALNGTFSIPNVTVTAITLTNNGALTVGTALAGTGALTNAGTGTLNIGGTSAITALTANAVGNTVNYTGTGQTLKVTPYHHLSLTGGAETFGAITTIAGNLALIGSATATTGANLTVSGNLNIGSGTTFATGATFTLGVTGTTSITGTFTLAGTGAKTFTGDVTMNAGGVWNETGIAAFSIAGNFTNNGTTFTASTGVHTFSGGAKTLSGSTAIVIPSAAFTGDYTNSGTLTCATALSGAGQITNDATGTLNVGGTSAITALVAGAVGNTVNYTGAAQIVHNNDYHHLALSGSGAKTLQAGTATIGGNLTLSGTATTTTVAALMVSGNLSVGNGTTFTAAGFALTVTGTTTVGAGASGMLTISSAAGAKQFVGLVSVSAGGTWNNSGNSPIELQGGLTNDATGTFTAGTGAYTFTTNAQALNGTFSIPSITVTTITLTNNGTLTVGTALTGTGGLTNAGTGTLNLGGSSAITTLTANAGGNTVNFNGTGAQTVKGVTYSNLTINKATGTATLGGAVTATAFTMTAGTLDPGSFLLTATTSSTLTAGTLKVGATTWGGNYSFAPTIPSGFTVDYYNGSQAIETYTYYDLILSGSGTKTFAASTTISNNLSITGTAIADLGPNPNSQTSSALTLGGTGQVAGTWGGTGSGATNINTTYFAPNSGQLTVGSSSISATWTGATNTVWATATNWSSGSVPDASTNVSIPSTANQPTIGANAVCNNLGILSGATLTVGGFTLTVSGATTVAGTLTLSSATGTKTFTGAVTISSGGTLTENSFAATLAFGSDVVINSGGTLTESGAAVVGVAGSLTNNGTYTASTGVHTFSGTTQTISGTNAISIPSVTASGTYTNNGTLTVGTALAGAGALTQGATGILNLGGTSIITTLTATASGNTVNYTGAAQTVHVNNYWNLTFSGSAAKTLNTSITTIGGNLTFAGTATATGLVGLTIGGTVTLGVGTTFTGGAFTHSVGGDWTNNGGTYTSAGSTVILNGSAQTIGGSAATTFNNLSLTGTTSITTAAALTVGGNLSIGDGTTLTAGAFALTVTGSTTVGSGSGSTATLTTNSATGAKTFTGAVTINSNGVVSETAAAALTFGSNVTISGTLTEFGAATVGIAGNLSNNGTYTASTGVHTFSGASKTIGGSAVIVIPSATFTGNYTNGGTLTCATALTVTGAAVVLTNNGTITATTSLAGTGGLTNPATYTLNIGGTCSITTLTNAGTATITGAGAISTALANLTNTGTLNLQGSGTIAGITNNTNGVVNLSSSGAITSFNNAGNPSTLNIIATTVPAITTLTVSAAGNTVNYSGAGAQTMKDAAYYHLTISGSGTKTWTETAARIMGGNLSVGDGTTLSIAGAFAWTVTGTTTIGSGTSGSLSITNATGTKTFTGAVTVNTGGSLTETVAAALSFGSDVTVSGTLTESGAATVDIAGSLTNNGTYTASTGVHTLSGTAQTVSGTSVVSIGSVAVTGTYTNNGTLTVGSALSGTGTLTSGATGTLNIGGTCSITGLANSGIVAITGAGAIATLLANFTNTGTLNLNGSGTINGITNNASGTINLASSGTITSLDNATAASTLDISAVPVPTITTLTATAAGNTVKYSSTAGAQTVKGTNYSNLTIDKSGQTGTLGASTTVAGTLTLTNGTLAVGANVLTLNGPTIAGSPANLSTTSSSSLTFGGSSAGVNMPSSVSALNNLIINNSNGITLNSSPTISGTLTFSSGKIATGSNNVIIGSSGSVSGAGAGNYVHGNLQKVFSTGAQSFTFDIGDASNYTPVVVAFANIATGGSLTVNTTQGQHPNISTSGINSSKDVARYSTLTPSGIAFTTYDATFTFINPADLVGSPATSKFVVRRYASSAWNSTTTGTLTSTTSQGTGISGMGDFIVGEQQPDATQSSLTPTSASITADGTSTQVLTVTAKDVSGNTLTSGGATVAITKSSGTGTIGSVTDVGNGTYTATVTSPTATGSGVFVAALGGQPVKSGTGSQTQATVNYVAGAADALQSTLTPASANITADGASTQVLTVTAKDVNGNTLTSGGSTVAITKSSGSGTIGSVTDVGNGTYTATVTSPTATGSGVFVAALGGQPVKSGTGSQTQATVNYGVGAADATQSTLTPASASITADGTSTQVLTVAAKDVSGNTLSSGGATVAITKSSGTGTIGSVTDVGNGTYTATVTSPTATGNGVFVAMLGGQPVKSGTGSQTQATVSYTAGAASQIAVNAGNGQSATVGTAVAILPSVVVKDVHNNPVSGVNVTFAVATGGGSGTVLTATTNASGIASVGSWTLGTTAGLNTLTATSGSLTGSPVTFMATGIAGAATQIAINAGDGQSATVGTAVATLPSVIVKDVHSNPVSGVSVTFAVATGGGSGTGLAATTNASGIASVGSWTLGAPIGSNTLTATSGTLTGSPVTFTATGTAGGAATVTLTSGNNQTAPVNTALSSPVVVMVTDAGGSPVSGVSVNFAIGSTPTGATGQSLSTTTSNTNASGQASTVMTLGSKVGTYQVIASSSGLTGSPIIFTVSATAGTATTLLSASGNGQSGGVRTALGQPLTVTVVDAYGNTVSGVGVNFAISSVPPSATGQVLSSTTVTSGVNGQASTLLTLGSKIGTYQVTATSAGLSGSPITFACNATVGAAATLHATSGDGQSGVVSTALGQPMTVTVVDVNGDPVSGIAVSFEISGTPSGSTGQLLNNSNVTTGMNGQASSVLTLGRKIGTYQVTATSAGLAGSPMVFSSTATVGSPTTLLSASGNGQSGEVGTVLTQPLTVTVVDANGNPVSGMAVNFSFVVAPSGSTGQSLSTSSVTTGVNGEASTMLTLGNKTGAYQVAVSSAGLVGSPVIFTSNATAGEAATLLLSSGDGQSGVVGTGLGQPLAVIVVDAYGNPAGGVGVSFSISSAPAGSTGQSLSTANATTGVNGQASTMLMLGSKVGVYQITASSAGLRGSPVVFTNTATVGIGTRLMVESGNGQSGVANRELRDMFVVTATDGQGNPVAGAKVRFAVTGIPAGSVGASLKDTIVETNAGGRATTKLKMGTKVGAYSVTATSAGLPGISVTFTATATAGVAAEMKIFSGDGQRGEAGTRLQSPFVVAVTDSFGNAVFGVDVMFSATGPGGATGQSVSAASMSTGVAGQASTVLTLGNKIGSYRVVASSNGLQNVEFASTATPGSPVSLLMNSGDGQTGSVRESLTLPMTVTVVDAHSNPVGGVSVSFTITDTPSAASGQALSAANVITDEDGHASAKLTMGDKPGTYRVTASSHGLAGSPIVFTGNAVVGVAAMLRAESGSGQSAVVGSQLANPLVVAVMDASGNPVEGTSVRFALSGTPSGAVRASLIDTVVVTDAGGRAVTRLRLGTKVGEYIVTASSLGLAGSPQVFNATAIAGQAATARLLTDSRVTGQVGSTLEQPFVVAVTDSFGNAVSGVNVRYLLTSSPVGAAGQEPRDTTVATDSRGQASIQFTTGTKTGMYVVTASAGTMSPLDITINAEPGTASSMAIVSGNNQRGIGKSTLSEKFIVVVTDALGNVKPGVTVQFAIPTVPLGAVGHALSSLEAVTDVLGRAAVQFRLGDLAGTYEVAATTQGQVGSPVVFTATVTIAGAAIMTYSGGDGQTARVMTQPAGQLSVTLLNPEGIPVPDQMVSFGIASMPEGAVGTALSDTLVRTNVLGQASVKLTVGTKVGLYAVTAMSGSLLGSPVTFRTTAIAGQPAFLQMVSGDNQSGLASNALFDPLVVMVTDLFGNANEGVAVNFAIKSFPDSATGQALTSTVATTDPDGRAAVSLTLGSRAGRYEITATSISLTGSPVTFRLNALTAAGGDQVGLVNIRLPQAFSTLVLDASGNPIPGVLVTFTIDSIPSGASGASFNNSPTVTVETDSAGVASVFLTLGNQAGTYRVTAASQSLVNGAIVFRATAVSNVVQPTLTYRSGDAQSAAILTQLVTPLEVTAIDASGAALSGRLITFTLVSGPAGTIAPLISSSTATTDGAGHASTLITLGDKVGVFKILASSPGLAGGPVEFRVTANPGVPRAFAAVAGNGQAKPVGLLLDSAFVVRVTDQGGNPVPGVSVQFTLDSIPSGSVGQKLTVLNSVTDGRGLASAILTLGTKAGTYAVSATSPALPQGRISFVSRANVGSAAIMISTSGNGQSAVTFTEFPAPFVVTIVDVGGNPVAGVNVVFAIDSIPAGAVGQSLRILNSVTDANGRASAFLKVGSLEGRYSVRASANTLIIGSAQFTGAATVLRGDVNKNNEVDIADLTSVIDHVLGKLVLAGNDSIKADVTKDGRIDIADVVAIRDILLEIPSMAAGSSSHIAGGKIGADAGAVSQRSVDNLKSEFVLTADGIRFDLTNTVPVKGLQLIIRFKPGVAIERPNLIFGRAKKQTFYYSLSSTELRIVAYNMNGIPLAEGEGPLFSVPIKTTEVSAIEFAQLTTSEKDNAVLADQAVKGLVAVRMVQPFELPGAYALRQNYPNPFNGETRIEYDVVASASGADVSVQVFNALGQKVKTLASGKHAARRYTVSWDGTDASGTRMPSGTYYYRLITETYMTAKKLILLK